MLLQKGMDFLMKGRTIFVIAHRLSKVRNSDCIMVLEQGRIIRFLNNTSSADIVEKCHHLMAHIKALQRENESLKSKAARTAFRRRSRRLRKCWRGR